MPDPNVDRWCQRGKIALWRGSDQEWNISADDDGCDSLIELIYLMLNAKWTCKTEVCLLTPDITANGSKANFQFAKSLLINHPKDRVDDYWQLEDGENPSLVMGADRLLEFKSAIEDIKRGNGDYAIGAEPERLWVWWWVGRD